MSFNDTVSDSQLSNVSLGLSQDTTNHILSAAGYINVNDCVTEQFITEYDEGEEEDEYGIVEQGTSSLSVRRAVFSATTQISPESSASQPVHVPTSPLASSYSSLPITPTNSLISWPSTQVGGNGGISPTILDSPPPPPPYSHNTSPLSHPPLPPPPHSICSNLPYNTPMKGRYGFDISLNTAHPQYSKTPHSVYSKIIQRMYIKKDADIPLSFTVQSFEGLQRCRLVITAVHKLPEMVAENLQCCIKHVDEQKRNGIHHPYHFVRSQMDGCAFFGNPVTPDQRLFIALPFSKLQRSGDSLFTALLKFPCFTSDFKKAGQLVQLIFRLELERELLGRAVLDVRVCASPGRDLSADERRGSEGGSGEDGGDRQRRRRGRKRAAPVKEEVEQCTFPPRKVTKVAKTKAEYTIETFPEIFPHVLEAVKLLERVFTVPLNLPDDLDSPTNTEPPQLHHHNSASTVESWLEGLGLSHHIPLFHRQGIGHTFQALSVTDNELKSWGVGDKERQTILEGITNLQERSSSLPSSSLHTLSQGSSTSGTQPFPPFEVIQIQARKKNIRLHN